MKLPILAFSLLAAIWPTAGDATVVAYSITVTTAYATGDPFPNRLEAAFIEPDTGYLQIANTGTSTFVGRAGTIAVSVFAGDLSFTSDIIVLMPGDAVSIAIPDDASDVGGFNGPAYFYRPGVEVSLNGTVSDGLSSEAVALLVADRDIHSGVPRTDSRGLTSDSFVLQGGDPWGFDPGDSFELSQANGVFVFTQTVPEPGSLVVLAGGLPLLAALRWSPGARRKAAGRRG